MPPFWRYFSSACRDVKYGACAGNFLLESILNTRADSGTMTIWSGGSSCPPCRSEVRDAIFVESFRVEPRPPVDVPVFPEVPPAPPPDIEPVEEQERKEEGDDDRQH